MWDEDVVDNVLVRVRFDFQPRDTTTNQFPALHARLTPRHAPHEMHLHFNKRYT